MRISDDRYSRDRLRIDIALNFIRHEARTHTIRQWTGLTDDRIRKLYRSYLSAGGHRVIRHRGKSPRQAGYFLRTARLRQEAAALAGLCGLVGLVGTRGAAGAPVPAPAPGIARAASLLQAYEAYGAIVGQPLIAFEHAVLLVTALGRGDELSLARCADCGVLLVADPLALRAPHCTLCTGEALRPASHRHMDH